MNCEHGTVSFERLESTGNFCNLKVGVCLPIQAGETPGQAMDRAQYVVDIAIAEKATRETKSYCESDSLGEM